MGKSISIGLCFFDLKSQIVPPLDDLKEKDKNTENLNIVNRSILIEVWYKESPNTE